MSPLATGQGNFAVLRILLEMAAMHFPSVGQQSPHLSPLGRLVSKQALLSELGSLEPSAERMTSETGRRSPRLQNPKSRRAGAAPSEAEVHSPPVQSYSPGCCADRQNSYSVHCCKPWAFLRKQSHSEAKLAASDARLVCLMCSGDPHQLYVLSSIGWGSRL